MLVPVEEKFVEIEHLGQAFELVLRQPNSRSDTLKGIQTPQYELHKHAWKLCHRFGFTDQSKREAFLSENIGDIKRVLVYVQGVIEAASEESAAVFVSFLAKLVGKKLVDEDAEISSPPRE